MSQDLVFSHGHGRDGRAAWPEQEREFPVAVYLERPTLDGLDSVDHAADAILSAASASTVVSHSFGAIAAARAMLVAGQRIRTGVFIEPALHSLARGEEAVERHIERVDAVFARTESSLEEFWRDFIKSKSPTATLDGDARRTAARIRRLGPPWHYPIELEGLDARPILVVTGGWNEEYEEIAARLGQYGARHLVLSGHGHRPQDHPDFNAALSNFVRELGAADAV